MQEIKKNSSVVGLERLAVMVALNIANDFLREKDKILGIKQSQDNTLEGLTEKVEKLYNDLRRRKLTRYRSNSLHNLVHVPGLFASRYVLDPLTKTGGLFLGRVHVRNTESLRQVGDHRLEPLGSRAYPNSGNLGNCYPDA